MKKNTANFEVENIANFDQCVSAEDAKIFREKVGNLEGSDAKSTLQFNPLNYEPQSEGVGNFVCDQFSKNDSSESLLVNDELNIPEEKRNISSPEEEKKLSEDRKNFLINRLYGLMEIADGINISTYYRKIFKDIDLSVLNSDILHKLESKLNNVCIDYEVYIGKNKEVWSTPFDKAARLLILAEVTNILGLIPEIDRLKDDCIKESSDELREAIKDDDIEIIEELKNDIKVLKFGSTLGRYNLVKDRLDNKKCNRFGPETTDKFLRYAFQVEVAPEKEGEFYEFLANFLSIPIVTVRGYHDKAKEIESNIPYFSEDDWKYYFDGDLDRVVSENKIYLKIKGVSSEKFIEYMDYAHEKMDAELAKKYEFAKYFPYALDPYKYACVETAHENAAGLIREYRIDLDKVEADEAIFQSEGYIDFEKMLHCLDDQEDQEVLGKLGREAYVKDDMHMFWAVCSRLEKVLGVA